MLDPIERLFFYFVLVVMVLDEASHIHTYIPLQLDRSVIESRQLHHCDLNGQGSIDLILKAKSSIDQISHKSRLAIFLIALASNIKYTTSCTALTHSILHRQSCFSFGNLQFILIKTFYLTVKLQLQNIKANQATQHTSMSFSTLLSLLLFCCVQYIPL